MRVGCKILQITKTQEGEWTIKVIGQTGVHESMNYASDFVPVSAGSKSEERVIVSTSFYDSLLFVWKFNPGVQGGAMDGGE